MMIKRPQDLRVMTKKKKQPLNDDEDNDTTSGWQQDPQMSTDKNDK